MKLCLEDEFNLYSPSWLLPSVQINWIDNWFFGLYWINRIELISGLSLLSKNEVEFNLMKFIDKLSVISYYITKTNIGQFERVTIQADLIGNQIKSHYCEWA